MTIGDTGSPSGMVNRVQGYDLPSESSQPPTAPRGAGADGAAGVLQELLAAGCDPGAAPIPMHPTESTHANGGYDPNDAALQAMLIMAGVDPGPIDGWYGPQTASAVAQFQRQHGLEVTGVVDAATWAKLQEVTGQRAGGVVPQLDVPSPGEQAVADASQTVAQLEALAAAHPDLADELADALGAANAKLDRTMEGLLTSRLEASGANPMTYEEYQVQVEADGAALRAQFADDPVALAALDRATGTLLSPEYLAEQRDAAQMQCDLYGIRARLDGHVTEAEGARLAEWEAEVGRLDALAQGAEAAQAGDSRPPGQPFTPIPLPEVHAIIDTANQTGDMSGLDALDSFRQTLPPEQQAEYDRQLDALRNNPLIRFAYPDGAAPNPAVEDMVLRGILAATFGRPQALQETLANAAATNGDVDGDGVGDGDGVVEIRIYSGPIPAHAEGNPDAAAGLAVWDGSVAIDQQQYIAWLADGDNALIHEFSHLMQRVGGDPVSDPYFSSVFPPDFPNAAGVHAAFGSADFQDFLRAEGYYNYTDYTYDQVQAEIFTTLQNLFKQRPEVLARESPEIYRAFVEYYGYDPLTQ